MTDTYPHWHEAGTTFVFEHPNPGPGSGVVLIINRITDKARLVRGVMHHVPNTNRFEITLSVPHTIRASYGFHLYERDLPDYPHPPTVADPLNPNPWLDGLSPLVGPLAPADPPMAPASYTNDGLIWRHYPKDPRGIVVIFDAEKWCEKLRLGFGPDWAVVGIANPDNAHRVAHLGGNDAIVEQLEKAVFTELSNFDTKVLAGQSLGGITALYANACHPDLFDHIIAQSPSMWWRQGTSRKPANLGDDARDWICEVYDNVRSTASIDLHVGAQEDLLVAHVARLYLQLTSQNIEARLHLADGGHDFLWWRAELVRAVQSLR